MDEHEKYLFDLRGYIVVKNALSSDQIADLSEQLEARRAGKDSHGFGSDRTRLSNEDAWSSSSMLEWGGAYIDLIDIPTIKPYLETVLGVNYRLDHDYIKIDDAASGRKLYLHGGGQGAGGDATLVGPTDGGQCYYRYNNGRFYNGLVAVAFELDTVTPGSGGFACVPGSHKANFELPREWQLSKQQEDIPDFVNRVAASAGDAIIFTEACLHGTVPWQGDGERRTIFYKYCPHAVAWGPCYYNADSYGDLTESQRAILMPPSAFGPSDRTMDVWKRAQADQAELQSLRKEVAALKQR